MRELFNIHTLKADKITGIGPADDGIPVLGLTFLRSAYVVFDRTNQQIALAQTNLNSTDSNIVEIPGNSSGLPNAVYITDAVTTVAGVSSTYGGLSLYQFPPSLNPTATSSAVSNNTSGPISYNTSSGSSRLSDGAYAGIAVAAVVVLVLLGAIYYLLKRLRKATQNREAGQATTFGEKAELPEDNAVLRKELTDDTRKLELDDPHTVLHPGLATTELEEQRLVREAGGSHLIELQGSIPQPHELPSS